MATAQLDLSGDQIQKLWEIADGTQCKIEQFSLPEVIDGRETIRSILAIHRVEDHTRYWVYPNGHVREWKREKGEMVDRSKDLPK